MEFGVGLDPTIGLSLDQQVEAVREAARLGYTSVWTPETTGMDSYQDCVLRWQASRAVGPAGVTTGIAVSPVLYRNPVAFTMSGGTVSAITGGKFIMGLGAGSAYRPALRQSLGVANISSLALRGSNRFPSFDGARRVGGRAGFVSGGVGWWRSVDEYGNVPGHPPRVDHIALAFILDVVSPIPGRPGPASCHARESRQGNPAAALAIRTLPETD